MSKRLALHALQHRLQRQHRNTRHVDMRYKETLRTGTTQLMLLEQSAPKAGADKRAHEEPMSITPAGCLRFQQRDGLWNCSRTQLQLAQMLLAASPA